LIALFLTGALCRSHCGWLLSNLDTNILNSYVCLRNYVAFASDLAMLSVILYYILFLLLLTNLQSLLFYCIYSLIFD